MDRLASMETFVRVVCVSAWKKDPSGGVIGVQKGPLC